MSSDTQRRLPYQAWPFLLSSVNTAIQRQVAQAIYNLRLSFIIPKQTKYTKSGSWFRVMLTSITQNTVTFTVRNTITNVVDTVQCTKGQNTSYTPLLNTNYSFSDNKGWIDPDNCLVQTTQNISTASGLSLQVCASCIMLSAKQPQISIACGGVHRKDVSDEAPKKQNTLHTLVFADGYNTQVSYDKNVLRIAVGPGAGVQMPFHYSYWQQYAGLSDSAVAGQRAGAYSINGLTGYVNINPSPSVAVLPQIQGNTLTLRLRSSLDDSQSRNEV